MSCDYHLLPHPGIQTLRPYIPGKAAEELAREQGLSDIIKLASNENPLGCSIKAKEALAKLSGLQLATYPSPMNHPLRFRLCKQLGIDEDMLTLSNGSDLLFSLILTTFALHTGKQMLTHEHAFISYEIQAQTLGIPVQKIPLCPNWQVDIDALVKASQLNNTAVIFLANPNNPTGLFIEPDNIKHLLDNVPSTTIVVLDEAYHEYAYDKDDRTSLYWLQQYPNLIITRTFSKAYGLAGLRLGYAIASPEITELLLRVQPPFAVNQAALEAANAAIDDEEFIARTIALNEQGMQQLQRGFDALKLNYLPSRCNFITLHCDINASVVYQNLLKEGVIVRPLASYQLPHHLRITIGTSIQNTRFLDKLAQCLAQN
ncbi:histidinol-phosphate transaminase [Legionella jamestowniensis]|uniref:Histidinol-phosphate aminotransferase n=1 Tax=Legionella jamestowniensis TaxID=455 RepID=A0A0W0UGG4_9GAMM|nr:histidinol-phosphate transaminase [Legionella jamestowniensis]KTD06994.1 histidinol-phosphate aminotransferase [Legionella jamestowniensis]OCH96774.1 histidinol-phosphate transaminase [Legionella jamestowniensis]SFM04050.1 histidinol-phosphate aminotransferase [Legionella jamestowniensis DSM 19215]